MFRSIKLSEATKKSILSLSKFIIYAALAGAIDAAIANYSKIAILQAIGPIMAGSLKAALTYVMIKKSQAQAEITQGDEQK